jgi:hypothetical protein
MWRSAQELEAELKSFPDLSQLNTLYSLSTFWRNAVYPADYRASEDWASVLTLTPYGEKRLNDLRPALTGTGLAQVDILLAYFAVFFHHDLFLDAGETDSTKIRHILEHELLQGQIRLPYRYGRLLYDRFNDTYSDTRTDHLMSADVERLLQGTPLGVYQLGTLVSGPLGVLDSQETRYIPPTLSLPLWHCSDTGCNAIHHVQQASSQF